MTHRRRPVGPSLFGDLDAPLPDDEDIYRDARAHETHETHEGASGDSCDSCVPAAGEVLRPDDDESEMTRAFRQFHAENPHVYELFVRFAVEAITSGRRRFGAKAIVERMRWHALIETRGEVWKLNDHYTAYYVRLFEQDHPEHAGFFSTRAALADAEL